MKKLSALMLIAILLVASVIPVFASNQTDSENIPPEEIVVDDESVSSLGAGAPVKALATGTPITTLADINTSADGNYYLDSDILNTDVTVLTIPVGVKITLDFNGHTIYRSDAGRPFNNSGTLTLLDSSSGGAGGVNGDFDSDDLAFGSVDNQSGGILTIESGTYSADNNGSCVRNLAGGTVFINGGTFTNIRGLANFGTATINGGTFNQPSFSGNNAYKIWNAGTLTINDATVNGRHGAVAHVDGNLTIENGTFTSTDFYALYINNDESESSGVITATINGGTYSSTNSFGLWVNLERGSQADSPITFTGGVFNGDTSGANILSPAAISSPISPQLSGGTYTNSDLRSYVATGYRQNQDDRTPFWTVVLDVYDVNVINGKTSSGKSSYAPGEEVTVIANTPERGYIFDKWTSTPTVTLFNTSGSSASFSMPADDITLTAEKKYVGISEYKVLSNFNDFKGSGTSSAKVQTNGDMFIDLYMGNKILSPKDYTINSNGDTITLNEAFLKTLSPGTYELQALYQLGFADLSLTVVKYDSGNPRTGDPINTSLFGLLVVLSLICIGASYKMRKAS